jgi:hypothetical protein
MNNPTVSRMSLSALRPALFRLVPALRENRETIEITHRGRVVAILSPPDGILWQRLRAPSVVDRVEVSDEGADALLRLVATAESAGFWVMYRSPISADSQHSIGLTQAGFTGWAGRPDNAFEAETREAVIADALSWLTDCERTGTARPQPLDDDYPRPDEDGAL